MGRTNELLAGLLSGEKKDPEAIPRVGNASLDRFGVERGFPDRATLSDIVTSPSDLSCFENTETRLRQQGHPRERKSFWCASLASPHEQ